MTFALRLVFDGEEFVARYRSIDELLSDEALRGVMGTGLVASCEIVAPDGRRIAKPPISTWDRLIDDVASNASTLLRLTRGRST